MVSGTIGIGFILTCIFVGCVCLLGLLTLFVKAENIERNVLVGGLTLATCLVSVLVLRNDFRNNFPYGAGALISVCILSLVGFGIGRVIDAILGGSATISLSQDEGTLGADLAD